MKLVETKKMVKTELIENISKRLNIKLGKSEQIVEIFFDSISSSLNRGERVELRGFGSFTTKIYGSYTGRNPSTGQEVHVPPKRLPVWRSGEQLRRRVDLKW